MVQHSNDDLVLETREKAGKYSESRITITETLDNWRLKLLINSSRQLSRVSVIVVVVLTPRPPLCVA